MRDFTTSTVALLQVMLLLVPKAHAQVNPVYIEGLPSPEKPTTSAPASPAASHVDNDGRGVIVQREKDAVPERRRALVIGNGSYERAPLRNPKNDAQLMAKALRRLGFEVSLALDANLDTMRTAVRAFGEELRAGGVGLFYYAGHGVQVDGQNYLVPLGNAIQHEGDVPDETIELADVLAKMGRSDNRMNIVILDACRNNPFASSTRGGIRGLAKNDRIPKGTFIAYATQPDGVAMDGDGRNSIYTQTLAREMLRPKQPIERVFKAVRREVATATKNQQISWDHSSLDGDFYFNTDGLEASHGIPAPKAGSIVVLNDASGPGALPWIAGGVGVAALAAGSVFGIMAISDQNEADRLCPGHANCSETALSINSRAIRNAKLSNVGIGLSVVGLGIATYLWLANGSSPDLARSTPQVFVAQRALQVSGSF